MAWISATMRDWWRSQERRQNMPQLSAKSGLPAAAPLQPGLPKAEPPHAGLVVDPIGSLSEATQRFHAWQLSSGFEILRAHHPIETAADAQNALLALQQPGCGALPTQPYALMDQPWHAPMQQGPLAPVGPSGAPVPGQ